jgi:phage N-6-adenine-methyltransferase
MSEILSPTGRTVAVSRRRAMGGHHTTAPTKDDWLTPPEILAALGPFDLDPCAGEVMPWRTAATMWTSREDGLAASWPADARVWLNPPFSQVKRWMPRMARHGRGTAIILARTETALFFATVWDAPTATAVLFLKGRPHFHVPPTGVQAKGNCGAPACLVAYGARDAESLRGCRLAGHLVELPRDGRRTSTVASVMAADRISLLAVPEPVEPG